MSTGLLGNLLARHAKHQVRVLVGLRVRLLAIGLVLGKLVHGRHLGVEHVKALGLPNDVEQVRNQHDWIICLRPSSLQVQEEGSFVQSPEIQAGGDGMAEQEQLLAQLLSLSTQIFVTAALETGFAATASNNAAFIMYSGRRPRLRTVASKGLSILPSESAVALVKNIEPMTALVQSPTHNDSRT